MREKILALARERLAGGLAQRIADAVAEAQGGGVPALAENPGTGVDRSGREL
jgi:hypothetical protein